MIFETFKVGLLQCNCTLLGNESDRTALVVDPGDDADLIMERLRAHDLQLRLIVCTHGHIDHVGAIHELQRQTGAPASLHNEDLFLFENLQRQAEWIGLAVPEQGQVDRFLSDGDAVACSEIEMEVLHTPGHTPGSLTFHVDRDRPVLFTGDTLFSNGIGRTDLWGGSLTTLLESINHRLMVFDDDTLVIPGHGPSTTIGRERTQNPFLTQISP